MTARDLYVAGARLLGLYFLLGGIVSLPQMLIAAEVATDNSGNVLRYVAATGMSTALLIGVGMLLIIRYRVTPGSPIQATLSSESFLTAGICFLGIYFIVNGVVSLGEELGRFLLVGDAAFGVPGLTAAGLHIGAGALLALRPHIVTGIVRVAA